jgi:prohibitin 1
MAQQQIPNIDNRSLGLGVIALALLLYGIGGCRIIQDGEVGVRRTLGKISESPMQAGIRWAPPLISVIERWDIKTQELTESASVPSSEGLISDMDVTVLYNVVDAPLIRRTIGPNFRSTVLLPFTREAIRTVVSGYPVKALYSDAGRTEISNKISTLIDKGLRERGIFIQAVLLRNVQLPRTFLASIEAKLRAEQEALQKEFELQKAEKDAEIEVARARGVAEANKIISDSISPQYVQYLWVQGLNDGNSEVIYVPTEANLPILEAMRAADIPKK